MTAGDLGAPVTLEPASLQRAAVRPDNSRAMVRSALYAAIIGGVLCTIPVAASFVLALPVAGFMSVLFYRRWTRAAEWRRGFPFKLGALTGVFVFVELLVIVAISSLSPTGQQHLRETTLAAIQQVQSRATDPQMRQVYDYFKTRDGMAIMLVMEFF
ncbi:MAG TPA: hypothetical protein VJ728_04570, partial [Candidatus Binataceae bacterium]|nr:hypothetical protein [Candidatus Binataceae bacterium]